MTLTKELPAAALMYVFALQAKGDVGGMIWEMMDWDDEEAVRRRWAAIRDAIRTPPDSESP